MQISEELLLQLPQFAGIIIDFFFFFKYGLRLFSAFPYFDQGKRGLRSYMA